MWAEHRLGLALSLMFLLCSWQFVHANLEARSLDLSQLIQCKRPFLESSRAPHPTCVACAVADDGPLSRGAGPSCSIARAPSLECRPQSSDQLSVGFLQLRHLEVCQCVWQPKRLKTCRSVKSKSRRCGRQASMHVCRKRRLLAACAGGSAVIRSGLCGPP